MKKSLIDAYNKQIQHELTASYTYLGLALWFEQEMFKGFAAWMKKQSEEERAHAKKFVEFLEDRGATVTLGAIEAPKTKFASVAEAFGAAMAFEKHTTELIWSLHDQAKKENDLAAVEQLQWFIKEQVEEEKWATDFVTMADKIGSSLGAMFQFDHRVAKMAAGGE